MNRIVRCIGLVIWVLLGSCGDDRGSDGNRISLISFDIDGSSYRPDAVYALNDQETIPKRFGAHWAYVIHSSEVDGFCLTINVPSVLSSGIVLVQPVIDPPEAELLLVLHPCSQFDTHQLYLPAVDSTVNVQILDDNSNNLVMTFDSLTLRNGCGDKLTLTDGAIDVHLSVDDDFPDSAFNWAPSETIYPENHAMITLNGPTQAFTAVYSRLKTNSERPDT